MQLGHKSETHQRGPSVNFPRFVWTIRAVQPQQCEKSAGIGECGLLFMTANTQQLASIRPQVNVFTADGCSGSRQSKNVSEFTDIAVHTVCAYNQQQA